MKKIVLLFIAFLLIFANSNAQIKLNLLDGKQIDLKNYVFHNSENYLDYSFVNSKGKTKNSFSDLNDVYSISINGKDSIIYSQILDEEFSVDEMSQIVIGRQLALKEYSPWWAFASGMIIGCGSMFIPMDATTKLLIPIAYTTGMAFVRPSDSYIRKRHENNMNDDLFVYGYKSTGRKKIFKNTTLGVLGGIFVSGAIWTTLYFANGE
ncbi:MAG: hypothetical protein JXR36_10655 [Bacteroidales bacterium]|nr:hypothetical protein [Bacteroidales bacterium]